MPRTKLQKKKRNRGSSESDGKETASQAMRLLLDENIFQAETMYEQTIDLVESMFRDIKLSLQPHIFEMTMDVFESWDPLNKTVGAIGNATQNNQTNTTTNRSQDDEDSTAHGSRRPSRSVRPAGPYASARAKPRRSKSAQSVSTSKRTTTTTAHTSVADSSKSLHVSRHKYRTPQQQPRLQTMSADRTFNPVTPKIAANKPINMFRYPKLGETIISLSGSPVVAQGCVQQEANINIPTMDGVFCVNPSAMGSADPDIFNRIDAETLGQLQQLQSNLNLIINHAKRY